VKDARNYNNLDDRTITWNGHTSQTSTLVDDVATSFFTSDLAKEYFGANTGPINWDAQQYHFHAPSEHTFDG